MFFAWRVYWWNWSLIGCFKNISFNCSILWLEGSLEMWQLFSNKANHQPVVVWWKKKRCFKRMCAPQLQNQPTSTNQVRANSVGKNICFTPTKTTSRKTSLCFQHLLSCPFRIHAIFGDGPNVPCTMCLYDYHVPTLQQLPQQMFEHLRQGRLAIAPVATWHEKVCLKVPFAELFERSGQRDIGFLWLCGCDKIWNIKCQWNKETEILFVSHKWPCHLR